MLTLTVTEAAYRTPVAGEDSAISRLVAGLRARFRTDAAPLAIVPCDNVPDNGGVLRALLRSAAAGADRALREWIDTEVSIATTVVDRITPATTDADRVAVTEQFGIEDGWPVVCEPFAQWVLEDRFTAGRPALEDAGVHLVDDVVPYELMKLRLLNAGHQALCYLAHLAGYQYADEATRDEVFGAFVHAYMTREGIPTLPQVPGVDLHEYAGTLVERFANPEIRDTLARLCTDTSDRIPKFLLPVVRTQLAEGGEVHRAALVVAAWARYAEGVDEQGRPFEINDRRRDQVAANAKRQQDEPLAFIRDRSLFGDLAEDSRFSAAYLE